MCDDSFSDNSANAICREMGYSGSSSWVSGSSYSYGESQAILDINLDDVRCSTGNWDSCSYSTYDNCGHSEDVFLVCVEGIIKIIIILNHDHSSIRHNRFVLFD